MNNSVRSVLATAILTLLFAAVSVNALAQSFEGVLLVNATTERGVMPMTYMLKGDNARMEFEGRPGMTAVMLMNGKENKSYMLMTQMKAYMELPSGEKQGDSAKPQLKKTGKTQKLLGYNCEQFIVKSADQESEIWVTKELGKFVMFRMGGMRQEQSSRDSWQESFAGSNWFPLLASTKKGEKELGKFEVTKIEKKQLEASLFTIPEGYQKFDPAMMRRPKQ